MVDDDVSTLLKLDEKGFHAGGTVQAGSRPLFVASGGFTVNPPDLTSAGDRLRSLLATARDTVQEAAHDLPDPSPTVGDAIEALRSAVADLRSDLPDGSDLRDAMPDLRRDVPDLRASAAGLAAAIPNALPSPDPERLAADARHLTDRARQAVGLAPRSVALVDRIPRWLPGGLLAIGAVAAAGAVIVLWDPVHGARRRRRLIARARLLRSRILGGAPADRGATSSGPGTPAATPTRIDPVAIPIAPDQTPVVGVHLRD